MMKRVVSICAIALLSLVVLSSMPVEAKAAKYTIRLGHVLAETHASHLTLEEAFKKQIEEKTNGDIVVELYANAQLGSDRQTVESVSIGTLEASVAIGSTLLNYDDRASVMDLPYLFDTHKAARAAFDGDFGEKFNEICLKNNMVILAWGENGFRNVTNNRGPVYKPEDLKGLKIRTMETPYHVRAFKLWGANPTPMSFGELYTALQQGTVDAQENPISIIYTSKLNEVQDYCSLTGHVYGTAVLFFSKSFLDSLPKEYQTIVIEAGKSWEKAQREVAYQQDTELIDELKALGMKINDLTLEQKSKFREAAGPLYEEYAKQYGEELIDLAMQYNK